ncbi:MAG: ATP-binding protein [Candidatus Micrarchaeia archaeon]|jgi:hypothetical protein
MAYKKYKRALIDEVLKYLDSRECIVIYGARQVGKTSLLEYLLENHLRSNAFYFDLELPNLLELCNKGAEQVYEYLMQKGANPKQKIWLVLDEVQYLENPARFIKIFHDHYENVKLLVSGSSSFEIKRKFKESLAGRTINFELYPLSFEEFLLFRGKTYSLKSENSSEINSELVPLAEEYIRFGGYPKIVLEPSEEKKFTFLSQIIGTYVMKDIRNLADIRDLQSFNRLLEVLASQSGNLVNISELANTIGIGRLAVSSYIDILEKTFILRLVTPFHKNIRTELSKNPKIFFLDTGMMHLLWLKEFPKAIPGNSFETFVFCELLKAGKRLHFWRTTNKQEVDFVIEGKTMYGVEAKYSFQNAQQRNLAAFAREYGCKTSIVSMAGRKENGKYPWELIKEVE